MFFRISDSPSIDSEKHTYGDGSAVERRHFVSRDYLRCRTFSCVFCITQALLYCSMASIRRKKHGGKCKRSSDCKSLKTIMWSLQRMND